MGTESMYLKPNTVIEPLVDKWYAWSHLISPATAAMNIMHRHLKIMESYVQAPQIHASAVENPKMRGGPFMDLKGKRVEEVIGLREETINRQQKLIKLANSITRLFEILEAEANGHSLEPLYQKVPANLKGYVELNYDLQNHASFRFFEALLYKSELYDKESQSIALWLANNDDRPFVLSTPRLPEENVLHLNIPFDDQIIDDLGKMKREPGNYIDLVKKLDLSSQENELFHSFFTTKRPRPYQKYTGDKIRMRYFGHACILIETKDFSILLDPVVSYYGYPQEVDRFSDMDLPDEIDYVLITHNHQDHILFETLLPLRHKVKSLVVPKTNSGALQDPDLLLMFKHIGFPQVQEIGEFEVASTKDCEITGIPFIGEHSDLKIYTKLCYHLRIGHFSMLFVADSNNIEPELYNHVHHQVGDVDVVFLGMECDGAPLSWLYGPLLPQRLDRDMDQSRRLAGSDFEKGKALIDVFSPSEVYVYAMGQEPWLEYISSIKYTSESNPIIQSDKLINLYKEKGIVAERLFGEKEILYEKSTYQFK